MFKFALHFLIFFPKFTNFLNRITQTAFHNLKRIVMYRTVLQREVISFPIIHPKFNIDFESVTWTLWLQGIDKAPEIVKLCVHSFNNIKGRDLIFLNEANISEYVNIPDAILDKYHSGVISATAFSEIVRLEILATYGGLWLDSTIFIPSGLKYEFSELSFFSPKAKVEKEFGELFGHFAMFMLYCESNYAPIVNVRNKLLTYWTRYNSQIDYFIVDYFFEYEYENNSKFQQDVELNPVIGKNIHDLESYFLYKAYDKGIEDFICCDPLGAFKLNYKVDYPFFDSSGHETLYSRVISGGFKS